MTTKTYEIREQGHTFATVEATSAMEALKTARIDYPRLACDYNMEPGDEAFTVTWHAWEVDGDEHETLLVCVPSV